jgi:hypothetical protein
MPGIRQGESSYLWRRAGKSELKVIDPLEQAIVRATYATKWVEHQRVNRNLLRLRQVSPEMAELIQEIKPKIVPVAKVAHEAAFDMGLRRQLLKFADQLNVRVRRELRMGPLLGKYQKGIKGTGQITLRHSAQEITLAHELGHHLDFLLGLEDKFIKFYDASLTKIAKGTSKKKGYKPGDVVPDEARIKNLRVKINNELRDIADHRKQEGREAYTHKGEEKMAEMIANYVTAPDLMRQIAPETMKLLESFMEKYEELRPLKKMGHTLERGIEYMEEVVYRRSPFQPQGTFTVWIDGKRRFFTAPPDLMRSISTLRPQELNRVVQYASKVTKVLRVGATSALEFMIRNPMSDQFSAYVFSNYGYIPVYDAMRGAFDMLTSRMPYKGAGKWYKEYMESGGAHEALLAVDRARAQYRLHDITGRRTAAEKARTYANPLNALRDLATLGERMTRVGNYRRARVGSPLRYIGMGRKGVSMMEAMSDSREVILDFARVGESGRNINALVAFWNANVQGWNKMARSFRQNPVRTSYKIATGITAPTIALWLQNHDQRIYQEFKQWERDMYWHFYVGNPDDPASWWRIRKPFDLGMLFGSTTEHILDWLYMNKPMSIPEIAKASFGSWTNWILPTAMSPALEVGSNWSYFRGQKIVPEGQEDLPTEYQFGKYTPEVLKRIGETIGVAPSNIEQMIYGYTGGLGRTIVQMADRAMINALIIQDPKRPEPGHWAEDMPGIRALKPIAPLGTRSQSVQEFYEMYEKASTYRNSLKRLRDRGIDTLKLIRKHPGLMMADYLEQVAQGFRIMNATRTKLFYSDLSPKEKARHIREIENNMTDVARMVMSTSKTQQQEIEKMFERLNQ